MAEHEWPKQPFRQHVISEWTDYNGHLNVAYYALIFDHATDYMLDSFQLGRHYAETERCSTFALESHTRYLAEVADGEEVTIRTSLLELDAKRIRYGHEMTRGSDDALAATLEQISIHVDLAERRVTPWPESMRDRLTAAAKPAKPAKGFSKLAIARPSRAKG